MGKTRLSAVAGLSAMFLVLGSLMAAPAFAAATCSVDAEGVVMTVAMDGTATTIVRDETDKIKVSSGAAEVECTGGWPYTVFDIDSVNVTGTGALTIDMAGGAFAPGWSSETGTDEIEFYLADALSLTINGTPAADRWSFTTAGVGLNGDSDADIMGGSSSGVEDLAVASLTANGLDGNDTFDQDSKGAGDTGEIMNGDDGRDTVDYSERTEAMPVTVTIGADADDGEDTEDDNVAADIETVIGGAGNDTITAPTGGTTKFRLEGGDGDDELTGGSVGDTLFGDAGEDTLNGGDGRDFLNGGADDDTENGDGGNDSFDQEREENGGDILDGGAGKDTVKYRLRSTGVLIDLDNVADDGACVDTNCATSSEGDNVMDDVEVVVGGKATDFLTASPLGTKLNGGGGDDKLTGGSGKDSLLGGAGDDTLVGGAGNDYLAGGSDDDIMVGGSDDDKLSGGSGNDAMNGEAGTDRVSGSSGSDRLWGDGPSDKVKDTLVGGSQPSSGSDKCEVDPKDQRSGCEGKLKSADAPTTADPTV